MKVIYYQGKKNIGDYLNEIIFQPIVESTRNTNTAIIGIGSIINEEFLLSKEIEKFEKKIVFGSGFRPSIHRITRKHLNNIVFNDSWDFQFVRGPLSAKILDAPYISDGAYALPFIEDFKKIKTLNKSKIGIIPHFASLNTINWEKFCKQNGLIFINPIVETDIYFSLNQIASCNYVFCEAMHGAIIADILRIPWRRFSLFSHLKENDLISEFKWNDWLSSIQLNNIEVDYLSIQSHYANKIFNKLLEGNANIILTSKKKAYQQLSSLVNRKPKFYLSSENIYNSILDQIETKISRLKELNRHR